MTFEEKIAPYIIAYAREYGVKAYSAVIGQAILESTNGKSELAVNAHNYFGLKYKASDPNRCPSANGIYYKVGSEQNKDGSYVSALMEWQKFDSMEKGVKGYFDFLFNSKWADYSKARGVNDPETYLTILKEAGYASSISYVKKVMDVIQLYGLTKYDEIKYYRVQLGAYRIRSNAEWAKAQFDMRGMPCIIKYIDGLYKLQLGAYSSEENAKKKLTAVKAIEPRAFITYS